MKNILLAIFILSVYSLQSCTQQGACEGRIIIENPLPDITIQLEDGEHTIDLSSPPVFKHTASKSIAISSYVFQGGAILDSDDIEKDTSGTEVPFLILNPREKGMAKVAVVAADGCIEGVREEFTVTIE